MAGLCQTCICCLPNVHAHSIHIYSCSQTGSLLVPFGLPAGLGCLCEDTQQQSSGTGSALEKMPKVVIACFAVDTTIVLPVRVFTMKHDSDVCCMQVLTMVNNQHYLYRMTVLVAITSLASVVSHETLYQTILPAVVSCAKDKVICQSETFLKQLCVECACLVFANVCQSRLHSICGFTMSMTWHFDCC